MKKVIVVLIMFLSFVMVAQEKLKNKKAEFEVSGNCDMCKKRIEKAAMSVKGVKMASWHADHQDIHIVFDENKCSVTDVQKAIAKVGHDTETVKATDEAYDKMHGCCKYRD
jgi:periplasmic mercuric ion binding protein